MTVLKALNETLRFVIEVALVAVAFWVGYGLGANFLSGVATGALLAVLFAVVWGLFAAPKRRFATPAWVPSVMFLGFGALAVWALAADGRTQLAAVLGVLVVANEGARLSGLEVVNRVDGRG